MPPKNIHILGIDPGGTTGWAWLTVPRASLFPSSVDGYVSSRIVEWDYDEITGQEEDQVLELARLIREIQGLDYKVGPALVVEDFDNATNVNDPEVFSPIRIAAMLRYAVFRGECRDANMVLQRRGLAKGQITDERLKRWKLYPRTPGGHAADGMRHALMALRRAGQSDSFRNLLWDSRVLSS
jgi:hypothetical protein